MDRKKEMVLLLQKHTGVVRPRDSRRFCNEISYLTLAPYRERIVNSDKAGLLTCIIFIVLPIRRSEQWTYTDENVEDTYSCATVRDLHTIPY